MDRSTLSRSEDLEEVEIEGQPENDIIHRLRRSVHSQ